MAAIIAVVALFVVAPLASAHWVAVRQIKDVSGLATRMEQRAARAEGELVDERDRIAEWQAYGDHYYALWRQAQRDRPDPELVETQVGAIPAVPAVYNGSGAHRQINVDVIP